MIGAVCFRPSTDNQTACIMHRTEASADRLITKIDNRWAHREMDALDEHKVPAVIDRVR
jgi:hypothetical protein